MLDLNLAAVEGLMPDLTILLEIGADDAVARMGGERDRIEREDDGFHAPGRGRISSSSPSAIPTGTSCSTARASRMSWPRC